MTTLVIYVLWNQVLANIRYGMKTKLRSGIMMSSVLAQTFSEVLSELQLPPNVLRWGQPKEILEWLPAPLVLPKWQAMGVVLLPRPALPDLHLLMKDPGFSLCRYCDCTAKARSGTIDFRSLRLAYMQAL